MAGGRNGVRDTGSTTNAAQARKTPHDHSKQTSHPRLVNVARNGLNDGIIVMFCDSAYIWNLGIA